MVNGDKSINKKRADICFDYSKLLGRIREKGFTQNSLADNLGMKPTTLSLKLNNKGAFRQEEIVKSCALLDISQDEIGTFFYDEKV